MRESSRVKKLQSRSWRRKVTLLTVAAATAATSCSGFVNTVHTTSNSNSKSKSYSKVTIGGGGGCATVTSSPLIGPLHATLMSTSSGSSSSKRQIGTKAPWPGVTKSVKFGGTTIGSVHNSTTFLGFDISDTLSSKSSSDRSMKKTRDKKWLPYLPTRSQVNELDLADLQDACKDRRIQFFPADDQSMLAKRLLQWTAQQHRERVIQRRKNTNPPVDEGNFPSIQTRKPNLKVSSSRNQAPNLTTQKSKKTNKQIQRVDLNNIDATVKPLIHRRKELMASKTKPRKKVSPQPKPKSNKSPQDILSDLSKTFAAPPSLYSNYQVQQIYLEAKIADQNGQLDEAIALLQILLSATPHDMRVPRRLSRLHIAKGQISTARSILEEALVKSPQNPYLLHGLASIQIKHYHNYEVAKNLYEKAIKADPYMPNAHHALGTLEHSKGNIKSATEILRNGIQYCPDNHRLHHAMGDLYRDANMHSHAIKSYNRGIDVCEEQKKYYGQSFLHTATSFVMYDLGQIQECESHLKSAININPLHAQGWLAYAHFHQSEGNIPQARRIFERAANTFESKRMTSQNPQWRQVYLSWASMEETHGSTYHMANNVYSRAASKAFKYSPTDKYQILLSWAHFQWKQRFYDRAKTLFQLASDSLDTSHALPIRLQGQLEIASSANFKSARTILFNGAQKLCSSKAMSASSNTADAEDGIELAKLYHLWAICEWHLNNLDRAEMLLDHSLRLIPTSDNFTNNMHMRVAVLYSVGKFMHEARDDQILAQHCICLALSQDAKLPHLWSLWKSVALSAGNKKLAKQCETEITKLTNKKVIEDGTAELYKLSQINEADQFPFKLEGILRKAPWHSKLAPKKSMQHQENYNDAATWLNQLYFPSKKVKTKI